MKQEWYSLGSAFSRLSGFRVRTLLYLLLIRFFTKVSMVGSTTILFGAFEYTVRVEEVFLKFVRQWNCH